MAVASAEPYANLHLAQDRKPAILETSSFFGDLYQFQTAASQYDLDLYLECHDVSKNVQHSGIP